MNLVCKEVTPELAPEWNKLVANSPQGTIFHSEEWLTCIQNSYDLRLERWIIFDANNKAQGGGYVFLQRKFGLSVAYAPPGNVATPYGGILVVPASSLHTRKQEAQYKEISTLLLEKMLSLGPRAAFLTMSPQLTDIRSFQWKGWQSKVFYTYSVDLGTDDLFSKLDSTARNTIRKAEKVITIEQKRDPNSFYRLYQDTYQRKGKPAPVRLQFLEALLDKLGDRVRLYLAYDQENRLAAGAVWLRDEKSSYYWLAASDNELSRTGAPTLLLWKLLEESCGLVPVMDLVGANTEPIAFFKAVFNPKLLPYYGLEYTDLTYKTVAWARRRLQKVGK